MADTSPHTNTITLPVPATAAGADYTEPILNAAFAGFVKSVTFIPNATLTGAAAPNNRLLRVVNVGAGANGGGVAATVNLDGTNNRAANVPLTVPVGAAPVYNPEVDPSFNYIGENPNTGATGSNTFTPPVITLTPNSFQPGDTLQYQSTHTGTGVADPGGTLSVVVERAGNV